MHLESWLECLDKWYLFVTLKYEVINSKSHKQAVGLQWDLSHFLFQSGFKLELPAVCSVILENCFYFFKFSTGYSCILILYAICLKYFHWSPSFSFSFRQFALALYFCFCCAFLYEIRGTFYIYCRLRKTIFGYERESLTVASVA